MATVEPFTCTSTVLATPQTDKMKSCNAEAGDKKGDDRKAFMKTCLSAKPAEAAPSCASKAVSKDGKPLAGAAKDAFIKKCEKDAAAG